MRYPVKFRPALLVPTLLITAVLITALLAFSSARAQRDMPQAKALEEDIARLQEQVETLSDALTALSLLTADSYLDAAGFHAMDEALHAGQLNPRYLETVRITLTAVNAVTWPDALRDEVDAFTTAAKNLETALEDQDIAAAAEAAAQTHNQQHNLAHAIFAHLAPHNSVPHDSPREDADAATIPENARHFVLQIGENGGAVGGASTYQVHRDDPVALTVTSTVPGELHLHGYDREWELQGEEITITLHAEATGRFPLEFHPAGAERGVVVGYLEVRP